VMDLLIAIIKVDNKDTDIILDGTYSTMHYQNVFRYEVPFRIRRQYGQKCGYQAVRIHSW